MTIEAIDGKTVVNGFVVSDYTMDVELLKDLASKSEITINELHTTIPATGEKLSVLTLSFKFAKKCT